jgi:hypothetical protein
MKILALLLYLTFFTSCSGVAIAKEATDKNFNPFDVAGYGVGAGLVILTF